MKLLLHRSGWLVVAASLLLLAGCAPAPRGGEPLNAINQTLTEPVAPVAEAKPAEVAPPPEISSALIPPASQLGIGVERPAEENFDIAASQVPAREFFMGLVEGSLVNMVVHPEVEG